MECPFQNRQEVLRLSDDPQADAERLGVRLQCHLLAARPRACLSVPDHPLLQDKSKVGRPCDKDRLGHPNFGKLREMNDLLEAHPHIAAAAERALEDRFLKVSPDPERVTRRGWIVHLEAVAHAEKKQLEELRKKTQRK